MIEGGCECGTVRYRLRDAPIMVNCCHCRDCQKISGSAFALNAFIETGLVEVLAGEPERRTLEREGRAATHSWRCPTCATLLWADHPMFGDAALFVRAGTLDRGEALSPDAHYFVRSRHPWIPIPSGVAQFDTLPGDGPGVALEGIRGQRMAAIMSAMDPASH